MKNPFTKGELVKFKPDAVQKRRFAVDGVYGVVVYQPTSSTRITVRLFQNKEGASWPIHCWEHIHAEAVPDLVRLGFIPREYVPTIGGRHEQREGEHQGEVG